MPHLATIQTAFGQHDVTGVRAHTDPAAAAASKQLGAIAYASGNDIAFSSASPDLHTAAHEAAHVVQQRGGVQLKDGVGSTGDPYEVHADAVADAVVGGDSAAHLLDSMAGPAGPGTGSSSRSIQRQPAAAAVAGDPGAAIGMAQDPDRDRQTAATAKVVQAAARTHEQILKLRAARVSPAQAATTVADILTGAAPEVTLLSQAHQRSNPGGLGGAIRAMWTRGPGRDQPADSGADESHANVIASLDALLGDALEIGRALDQDAPESAPLARALGGLGVATTGLGWDRPTNLEDARSRSYARVACPAGENDESPNACMLTDGERADRRRDVVESLRKIATKFFKECKDKAAAFKKSLEADQRLAELVAGFAVDLMVGVITGGAGAVTSGMLGKIGKTYVPGSVDKFAGDFGKSLTKGAMGAAGKLGVKNELSDPRAKTMSALDALAAQFSTHVEDSVRMLDTLDDDGLIALQTKVDAYDKGQIETFVNRFADAYRTQVAPIGIEDPGSENLFKDDGVYRADKKAVPRAVKVVMPSGKIKLALVDEITDQTPGLRKAARTLGVAADRLIGDKDDHLFTGKGYRKRQDDYVNEAAVERHFIRWIDDPRMAAVADDDAATVRADKVEGIPVAATAMDAAGFPAAAPPP